jgi:hypothetical protein
MTWYDYLAPCLSESFPSVLNISRKNPSLDETAALKPANAVRRSASRCLHTWGRNSSNGGNRSASGWPMAQAIDCTLAHWAALTRHLYDGAVAIDNNHLVRKRQIKPGPWDAGHGCS